MLETFIPQNNRLAAAGGGCSRKRFDRQREVWVVSLVERRRGTLPPVLYAIEGMAPQEVQQTSGARWKATAPVGM